MGDSHVIRSLRSMAWERAKGELESIKYTFWGEEEQFQRFSEVIDNFIKEIEDHGLQE